MEGASGAVVISGAGEVIVSGAGIVVSGAGIVVDSAEGAGACVVSADMARSSLFTSLLE